ncbi:MAG: CBS domain-containing protein [Polyangiaceae bacterium]
MSGTDRALQSSVSERHELEEAKMDMQIRTPMTRDVIVAPPRLAIAEAWKALRRENIRHLPITQDGLLVGIVSDRDFLIAGRIHASGEIAFPEQTVAEIMTMKPIVCSPTSTVADAARLMTSKKIDALPVVAKDRLIGLVTSTDLLLLLVDHAPAEALPFEFRVKEAELTA